MFIYLPLYATIYTRKSFLFYPLFFFVGLHVMHAPTTAGSSYKGQLAYDSGTVSKCAIYCDFAILYIAVIAECVGGTMQSSVLFLEAVQSVLNVFEGY